MSLKDLIRSRASIEDIESTLDGLDHDARLAAIRELGGKEQKALFELASGRGCSLEDFVPGTRQPMEEVIHWGKNSLPLFTAFQKRFARPERSSQGPIAYGYNEGATRGLVGPGYFIAREKPHESGVPTVVIDYYSIPDEKPVSWPDIRPNSAGLSRFVYFQMEDWMWRVSKHVTIGRARRSGKWSENYFVLTREG